MSIVKIVSSKVILTTYWNTLDDTLLKKITENVFFEIPVVLVKHEKTHFHHLKSQ